MRQTPRFFFPGCWSEFGYR